VRKITFQILNLKVFCSSALAFPSVLINFITQQFIGKRKQAVMPSAPFLLQIFLKLRDA
jgi:hypothetical protein